MAEAITNITVADVIQQRSETLFHEHKQKIYVETDRLFVGLMFLQWVGGIIAALWISPQAWAGHVSHVHIHVWAAIFLGGLISFPPIILGLIKPGAPSTRYVISIAQMLTSALLIHLSGGRIETHFHVFGSLAFLAIYRDWPVLIPATIVVAIDHWVRGVYWPQSVFGVLVAEPWRWIEHAAWVLFEDIFLINSCLRSMREMKEIAERRARIELVNQQIEATVVERTKELSVSEEKTRLIIETANDAFIGMDENGLVTDWNKQAEIMFGWSRKEVLGSPLALTIIPERYREAHKKGIERFQATGEGPVLNQRIEISALRKNGHEFPVELTIWPVRVGQSCKFSAFIRDIRERKQTERRLAGQYAVTKVLAEADALEKATPRILEAVCTSLGWQFGEMWRVDSVKNKLRCVEMWHDSSIPMAKFEIATREVVFERGVGIPGLVWEKDQPIWIPDLTKEPRFLRTDSAIKEKLHSTFAFPIRVEAQVIGVLNFLSREIQQPDDKLLEMLTAIGSQIGQFIERKEAEEQLKIAQSQVIQAEKLNSVGRLASGVAHEVKNPLAILLQGVDYLTRNSNVKDENTQIALDSMRGAVRRADSVIKGLLDFASLTNMNIVSVHLKDIIESSLLLVRHEFDRLHIQINRNFEPGVPDLKLDKNRIEQVFVNLFLNAAYAMSDGGELNIKIYLKKLNEVGYCIGYRKNDVFKPGDTVVAMDAEDTGTGIPPDVLDKIFDPFFTTRRGTGGTGLGLSVVRNIIQMHQGLITMQNRETGKGARATILFRIL